MTTIAVIEDDRSLVFGLTEKLTSEGYRVIAATDGEQALDLLGREVPDLVLLDIMLPKASGLEVCRWVRTRYPRVPILILSARGQEEDKVAGLRTGADDYLTKPFGVRELLARIDALLRRAGGRGEFTFGAVTIDFDAGSVRRGGSGGEIQLTKTEFDLLRFFIRNEGRVLSRDEILDGVWGYGDAPSPRTVDFHVMTLRRKLEEDPGSPRHFLTVPTHGYRFVATV